MLGPEDDAKLKNQDIALEELEFDIITDKTKVQDYQVIHNNGQRDQIRSVFLEKQNKYIRSKDNNVFYVNQYAEQITAAFPEAKAKVDAVLSFHEALEMPYKRENEADQLIKISKEY